MSDAKLVGIREHAYDQGYFTANRQTDAYGDQRTESRMKYVNFHYPNQVLKDSIALQMSFFLGTDKTIRIPQPNDYQNHEVANKSKVHDETSPLVRHIVQKLHENIDDHADFIRACANQMEADMLANVLSKKKHDREKAENRTAIMDKSSVPALSTNAENDVVDLN